VTARKYVALGFLGFALAIVVVRAVNHSECNGEGLEPIWNGYYVIASTLTLGVATFLYVTTVAPRAIAVISAVVIAAIEGVGVFFLLALADVSPCFD
jgi:hypothetical protein